MPSASKKKQRLSKKVVEQQGDEESPPLEEEIEPLFFHDGQTGEQVEDDSDDSESSSVSEDESASEEKGEAGAASKQAEEAEDSDEDSEEEDDDEDSSSSDSDEDAKEKSARSDRLRFRLKNLIEASLAPKETRRQRKKASEETAGPGWFGFRRSTDERLKADAKVLENRNYVNPKRFYKKTDKVSPFAQIGTVIAGKFERRSNTIHKKERKNSLAAELLADDAAKAFTKRKYNELQDARRPRKNSPKKNTGNKHKRIASGSKKK